MMSTKLFRRSAVVCLLLAVISLLILGRFWSLGKSNVIDSSDESLIVRFHQHESEFNELIKMSKVDSRVVRIADTFTWLDSDASWPRPDSQIGFSSDRWNQYRRIFEALGLQQGLLRTLDTDTVYLIVSTEGNVTSGSSKGYAYSEKPLSPLSASLDRIPPELRDRTQVFRKLKENWYLYYQSN
jgi:hypothetical protein